MCVWMSGLRSQVSCEEVSESVRECEMVPVESWGAPLRLLRLSHHGHVFWRFASAHPSSVALPFWTLALSLKLLVQSVPTRPRTVSLAQPQGQPWSITMAGAHWYNPERIASTPYSVRCLRLLIEYALA